MPPSEKYDRKVEEMARQYDTAAIYLTAIIATLAAGATPSAIAQARALIAATLEALIAASVAWIGLNVPIIYRSGVEDAVRAVSGPEQEDSRRETDEAMARNEHREAMQALAEALNGDLQGAVSQMGRDAERQIGEIRRRRVSEALSKGSVDAGGFEEEMRERGVGFVDRAGRKWDAGVYARMCLRTHVATILNYGHLNKAIEMGSLYVRVFDGVDHDDACRRAHGQTWHVLAAIKEPLCHPNGKRSYAALGPDYDGPVDRDAEEAA